MCTAAATYDCNRRNPHFIFYIINNQVIRMICFLNLWIKIQSAVFDSWKTLWASWKYKTGSRVVQLQKQISWFIKYAVSKCIKSYDFQQSDILYKAGSRFENRYRFVRKNPTFKNFFISQMKWTIIFVVTFGLSSWKWSYGELKR